MRPTRAQRPSRILALAVYLSYLATTTPSIADLFEIGIPEIIAGGGAGDGGSALLASILPRDIIAAGDVLYIADEQFNRIRIVAGDGTISTAAGNGAFGIAGDGRQALDSALGVAASLAVAPDERLFFVDLASRQILFIDRDGVLGAFIGADHPLLSEIGGRFAPSSIAFGREGKLHVADRGNNVVWQFDPDGSGRRAGGNGARGFAGDGQPGALGQLADPRSIAVAADGSIYIADTGNRRVRVIGPDGRLRTVAGDGAGDASTAAGPALEVSIKPIDVALNDTGELLIIDELGNRLLRLRSDGTLETLAQFEGRAEPRAVTVTATGAVLVADSGNRLVHAVLDGGLTPLAGNGLVRASGDGQDARAASLHRPFAFSHDRAGNLYLADQLNHMIRRVGTDQRIARVAGTGVAQFSGDGGAALDAAFDHPSAIAIDGDGSLFIADTANHRVRRISRDGAISTAAGSGERGFAGDGGPATDAQLSSPQALAFDGRGRLLIVDTGNRRVRRVGHDGVITTVIGNGDLAPIAGGGPPLRSSLVSPSDVVSDGEGSLLLADAGAHRVYRLGPDDLLRVVAGTGEAGAAASGSLAATSPLNRPLGLAGDGFGGLFVADSGNHRVVHVDGDGVLRSLDLGIGAFEPSRLVRAPDGALVVGDLRSHRVYRVPIERRLAAASARVVTADGFSMQMVAAFDEPGLQQVVVDPTSNHVFATHTSGVESLLPGGGYRRFADIAPSMFAAVPVDGRFGRGLVIATPSFLGYSLPLTLVELDADGRALYLPLQHSFAGADAVAKDGDDGLFVYHHSGQLFRVDNVAEATQSGGGSSRFALFATLPGGEAVMHADPEGGLIIASRSTREVLRLVDLDGDGQASDPDEQQLLATLPEVPVGVVTVAGVPFVATEAGVLYRVVEGQALRIAEGFAPFVLSLGRDRSGSLLLLEGDDRGGRLIAISASRPALRTWPSRLDFGALPLGTPSSQVVVVRNDGPVSVAVTMESTSADIAASGPLVELRPGEHRELTIELAPRTPGLARDRLLWRGPAGDVLAEIPVEIRGLAPMLSAATEMAFAITWVGGSRTRQLSLQNSGELPLTLDRASIDSGGDVFDVQLAEAAVLDPGEELPLTVTFRPEARREYRGVLTLAANDPMSPQTRVELHGEGGRAELRLPDTYDIGAARAGGRVQRTFELTNVGELELRIDQILTGTRRLIATPRRLVIAAGETAVVEFDFRPQEHGPLEGLLRFYTNDPANREWTLPFRGRGVSSLFALGAERHDFGATAMGEAKRWNLELSNFHSRPVRILTATSNSRQFGIDSVPSHVRPGESEAITLQFEPTRVGRATGALTIETDLREARRLVVPLSGYAPVASTVHLGPPTATALWPGEIVDVSLRIEGAHRLRGLVLDLHYPDELEYAGIDLPAESFFAAAGQPLLIADAGEGIASVGLSVTGPYLQTGLSGAGQLAAVRFKVKRALNGGKIALHRAIFRSSQGSSDTLVVDSYVTLHIALRGDLDGDGELTLSDFFVLADRIVLAGRIALGVDPNGADAAFDLTGDGAIDAADAELMAHHLDPAAAKVASGIDLTSAGVGLQPAHPNPFNSGTSLVFVLSGEGPVVLAVYNTLGQELRTLVAGTLGAGIHRLGWNGLDDRGHPVTSGVYFAVLTTPTRRWVQRLTLLR